MLVVMFYLLRYLIYYVVLVFCLGGLGCTFYFGSVCLPYAFPWMQQRVLALPWKLSVPLADCYAALAAVVPVACWLVLRNTGYGWFFQDLIGTSVLCMMQRSARLPSMRIATLLLSLMFFYDIFWVFVSPLLFKKSVMVEVAKGGGAGEPMPVVLRIPAISDPLGSERILGFGDVVLPGLLATYLLRHDLLSGRRLWAGYFVPVLAGYAAGLTATMLALIMLRLAQPALLYLVPGTLGTALALALRRGELTSLWHGLAAPHED